MRVFFLLVGLLIAFQAIGQEKWTNWLGNQSCNPMRILEPKTVDELSQAIQEGAAQGYRIRAVGAGYSISEIGCTDGLLLNLKHLNHILAIDKEKQLVRVEGGITLHELNKQLAHEGLALSNLPAISSMTLAGALSTAAHGTGHTGTLSSFTKSLELISADGKIHNLTLESDPEAFAAARVSFGSLGIIYAVTLQCEPLFHLKLIQEVIDFDEMLAHYHEWHERNDYFQFEWDLENGKALIMRWVKTPCLPDTTPAYQTLHFYTPDPNIKELFSEIALPYDALPKAIPEIKTLMEKYKSKGAKITYSNVRFTEADQHAYLSPSLNRKTAYVYVEMAHHDNGISFYRELEDLMLSYQGRPHWGKINFLDFDKAMKVYGSNLEQFIKVKKRLDPQGVFSNAYTDQLFGIKNSQATLK